MSEYAKKMLWFQITRQLTNLYKYALNSIQSNQIEHKIMKGKLKAAIPEQYHAIIDASDYFDDAKLGLYRKNILGFGNDRIRELETFMEKFSIDFNGNE